jgi:hypothetical protein
MDIYDLAGLDGVSLADAISQRFADCEPLIVGAFGCECWMTYSPDPNRIQWTIRGMRPSDRANYSYALQNAADPIIRALGCGELEASGVAEGAQGLPERPIAPTFFRTHNWMLYREGSRLVDLRPSGREQKFGCVDVWLTRPNTFLQDPDQSVGCNIAAATDFVGSDISEKGSTKNTKKRASPKLDAVIKAMDDLNLPRDRTTREWIPQVRQQLKDNGETVPSKPSHADDEALRKLIQKAQRKRLQDTRSHP